MESIVNNLSTITTIPVNSLQKLKEKEIFLICNAMEEAMLQNESFVELNIWIGVLSRAIENNSIKYKFVPSTKLEKNLVSTIKDKHNPLTVAFEESLADKIMKTYKDMMW